ncbi:myeloid leukemia factor 1 isoform X2 [Parambassis ranga]|uniref:Myeloid leukemia factor 1 isoform X2 n=1 Tax=Parambassis ranga TaxID=210632 RepID=A0A6P7JH21_9TELE|nr:myeloid leukemia factor 1-like isoform X2 [Parambassis ranga]
MFNSVPRDFDEDPFFSDPFRAHREHMRQMMRSFSEPLGGSLMPSIMDERNRGRNAIEHPGPSLRNEHRDMMMNPFGMIDNMMSNVRNRMEEMNKNFGSMATDSNAHSFSSSSVMTYSKVGNEPPKVFQATSTTRRAPGGITETQQALKDSESGLQKMRIGHHIQDRGHVVEKKYNKKTGEKEFNQDFQNMDESEAQSFEDEWQQVVSKFQPSAPMSHLKEPQARAVHRAAIAGPEQTNRDQPRSKGVGKGTPEASSSTKQ